MTASIFGGVNLREQCSSHADNRHASKAKRRSLSPSEESIMYVLWDTELYGRQIRDAIAEVSGNERKIPLGTIQPTLAKLERQKLLKSRWAPGTARLQGGKRRLYQLSEAGKQCLVEQQEFREQLRDWKPKSDREDEQAEEKE